MTTTKRHPVLRLEANPQSISFEDAAALLTSTANANATGRIGSALCTIDWELGPALRTLAKAEFGDDGLPSITISGAGSHQKILSVRTPHGEIQWYVRPGALPFRNNDPWERS